MAELARRGFANAHSLAYQSRVGPVTWLQPYTDVVIQELGASGIKKLCVVPVSFVSEHIETLEEIDCEYKELALESGIEQWGRVPALGLDARFIDALSDAVVEALPGLKVSRPARPLSAPAPLLRVPRLLCCPVGCERVRCGVLCVCVYVCVCVCACVACVRGLARARGHRQAHRTLRCDRPARARTRSRRPAPPPRLLSRARALASASARAQTPTVRAINEGTPVSLRIINDLVALSRKEELKLPPKRERFGFNDDAERINGRIAMAGIAMFGLGALPSLLEMALRIQREMPPL
jgi:hypothetical protein